MKSFVRSIFMVLVMVPMHIFAFSFGLPKIKEEKSERMVFINKAGNGHSVTVRAFYAENQDRLVQKGLARNWAEYFKKHPEVDAYSNAQRKRKVNEKKEAGVLHANEIGEFTYPRGVRFEKILIEQHRDSTGEFIESAVLDPEEFEDGAQGKGPYAAAYDMDQHKMQFKIGIEELDDENGERRLRFIIRPLVKTPKSSPSSSPRK